MKDMESKKIEDLWEWFIENEQIILDFMEKDVLEHRSFISESLDSLVLDLGRFSWEIGPGAQTSWYFCISPNEDQELFLISQKIMNAAPPLGAWDFFSSKPPKDWERQMLIYDELMNEVEIDAQDWTFVAKKKLNGKYFIQFEAPDLRDLDKETRKEAAHKVVLYELGEAFKMTRVSAVEIVDQLEEEKQSLKSPISELRLQLNPLF